jgi:protein-L-isoaspartate(D-aspartate) O-methyltransferase
MDLGLRRRFFAEDLEAVYRLRSAAVVDAFATVPREQFLPPGPWTVVVDASNGLGSGLQTRVTADGDPARVYHNIGVAIDSSRQLFNGQPGTVAPWIDALDLVPGERVLHVGSGLGYYTAILARVVGSAGRVLAFEADDQLANEARGNLMPYRQVDVRCTDGCEPLDEHFDGILVNAGVTHPLDSWLDAVAPGGRIVLPLTGALAAMGSNIGKGIVLLMTKRDTGDFAARSIGFVAIYSAVGVRDPEMNDRLGKAMMAGSASWQGITRLRRDAHELSASCWLHGATFCLSA